jgi:glycosyltransferase involved in cell wall biosynthesis
MARVEVVVHPSLTEGFGRVVLEAMALGRSVVASRVGGLREAIEDGENGYLITPGDVVAMADRIARLIRDSSLRARLGAAARVTVQERYQVEDKVRGIEEVWVQMARRRRD